MWRMQGQAASQGFFAGPAHVLTAQQTTYEFSGNPAQEAVALRDAVAAAAVELTALLEKCEGDAADVIGFQVAMLEDEKLVAPSWHFISNGAPADGAWRMAIDAQIENFQSSSDERFRARAADLEDMKQRVLRCLSGGGQSSVPSGTVLLGEDVSPSVFLSHDWSEGGAIVVSDGSSTSHVAMLARSRGVPMVVRAAPMPEAEPTHVLVDGMSGVVVCDADQKTLAEFQASISAFAERQKPM
jgi:phosphoenolpyruvate-protein phosphotransferase (PTS system enzyme I)